MTVILPYRTYHYIWKHNLPLRQTTETDNKSKHRSRDRGQQTTPPYGKYKYYVGLFRFFFIFVKVQESLISVSRVFQTKTVQPFKTFMEAYCVLFYIQFIFKYKITHSILHIVCSKPIQFRTYPFKNLILKKRKTSLDKVLWRTVLACDWLPLKANQTVSIQYKVK